MTIWLSHGTKLARGLATVWRVAITELIERGPAPVSAWSSPPRFGNDTETTQLREAVEAVLARICRRGYRKRSSICKLTATNGNVTETQPGGVPRRLTPRTRV